MKLKIITAFHGTVYHSNAFQDPDIYVPVYGGKTVSKYLPDRSKAMLKDNTGDNISWVNPFVGPITCLYWAWKNLDKLENPDWIGLNHYRRLFPIRKFFSLFDKEEKPFILISSKNTNMPVLSYAELEYGIGQDLEDLFREILKTDEEKAAYEYFKTVRSFAEKNLFIIPTTELDGYMNFMLRAIKALYKQFQYQYLEGMQYRRRTARMLEFVTAYYLVFMSAGHKYNHISINYEYPWKGFY